MDLCVLVLFFAFLSSRFIFSPGVTVDLPRSEQSPLSGVPAVSVLTVQAPDMLLFEGRVYTLSGLRPALIAFRKEIEEGILLVKVNRGTDIQTFLTVCDFAKEAEFNGVQIAAQQERQRAPPL